LEAVLGVAVPDLNVKITQFSTGLPDGNDVEVTLQVEFSNSNEDVWDMMYEVLPWIDGGAVTGIDDEGATITWNSGNSYTITFDVDVCQTPAGTELTIIKDLQDRSVVYEAMSDVQITLSQLCTDNYAQLIGYIAADAGLSFSDSWNSSSGMGTVGTEFAIGDTIYVNGEMDTVAALDDITVDSVTFTQGGVDTDVTSLITIVEETTTDLIFSLFLSGDFAVGSTSGESASLTVEYTINYANSRRLLIDSKSLHNSFIIKGQRLRSRSKEF